LYEIKYDGFRLLAGVHRGHVTLRSRPGADWTARLPAIAREVRALGRDVALDGELVYLADDGFPDFDRLRSAAQSGDSSRLYYQVFDLLSIDGRDLTSAPLLERKACLAEVLAGATGHRLRFVAHTTADGVAFHRAADELGLEGIVCKRARSIYRRGVRSADWVKVKCFRTQRFSIVGYTTENDVLASLVLAGTSESGTLHYAGQVEFGVPRRDPSLLNVLRQSRSLRREIANASRSKGIVWVEPRLSAEVRALMWQPGRSLRHAVLRSISP
jgi:bifunctional non-homologous end joining protein LigD